MYYSPIQKTSQNRHFDIEGGNGGVYGNVKKMKVYIPNNSKQTIGGGWTFRRSIQRGLPISWVDNWQDADIILIIGATMTNRDEMIEAKGVGKKIIMRVDNIPKDSNNRGTAFSRMIDFAKMSDYFIFQSEWAKDYAGWWFKDNGIEVDSKSSVIYNGVDIDVFYSKRTNNPSHYLFTRSGRDENKRPPEAFYIFHKEFRKNKNITLYIVGRFGDDFNDKLIQYKFDFFSGENIVFLSQIQDDEQMAEIYRDCGFLIFPAFLDASPNTVAEALACGCGIIGANPHGGTLEVIEKHKDKAYTIQEMGQDYLAVFNKVLNG